MKLVAALLCLAASTYCRPQERGFTPEQQLVIAQHNAIAAANAPSPFAAVPGFDEHQVSCDHTGGATVATVRLTLLSQAQLAAVLRLQGVDPGQQALDAAVALVKQQEAELAALG